MLNDCPDWDLNPGSTDHRSDALSIELNMGDNRLDEGAKEGKRKKRRKSTCSMRKGTDKR